MGINASEGEMKEGPGKTIDRLIKFATKGEVGERGREVVGRLVEVLT